MTRALALRHFLWQGTTVPLQTNFSILICSIFNLSAYHPSLRGTLQYVSNCKTAQIIKENRKTEINFDQNRKQNLRRRVRGWGRWGAHFPKINRKKIEPHRIANSKTRFWFCRKPRAKYWEQKLQTQCPLLPPPSTLHWHLVVPVFPTTGSYFHVPYASLVSPKPLGDPQQYAAQTKWYTKWIIYWIVDMKSTATIIVSLWIYNKILFPSLFIRNEWP